MIPKITVTDTDDEATEVKNVSQPNQYANNAPTQIRQHSLPASVTARRSTHRADFEETFSSRDRMGESMLGLVNDRY